MKGTYNAAKAPFVWGKLDSGKVATRVTELLTHNPCKTWQIVYVRNKKLAQLEG